MTVQFHFTLVAISLPDHLLSEPIHCSSLQTLVEADKVPLLVMQWVMQLFPKLILNKLHFKDQLNTHVHVLSRYKCTAVCFKLLFGLTLSPPRVSL